MKPTRDTPVDGTLFIVTQNGALAEGASVNGSVVGLCRNRFMEADAKDNVRILAGNVFKQGT